MENKEKLINRIHYIVNNIPSEYLSTFYEGMNDTLNTYEDVFDI